VDTEEHVTNRDRYHARAQLIAAIIGALIAGLLGGREWRDRALDRNTAVCDETIKQLRADLAERTKAVQQLNQRVDSQEEEIRRLRALPQPQPTKCPDTTTTTTPPETVVAVKEIAGVAFSLKGCRLSNSVLSCDLTVTNHDKDRLLEICTPCFRNASRLVDSEGNEYAPEAAYIGSDYTHRPTATLASEVPLKAGIRFNGIRSNPASIKLLELGVRIGFGGDYEVQFHDIALR
jgi:hypothetical protein